MDNTIFERFLKGLPLPFNDLDYSKIGKACNQTRAFLVKFNNEPDSGKVRALLGEITAFPIDDTTSVFPSFQINYGKNTKIGENVFINFNCTFLDLGGITIEDNVMLAPKVSLLSEGHPISTKHRQAPTTGKIYIKRNAWVGANATVLQGATLGEKSVVAAGSVVSNDVPNNTIVGGTPSKIINDKLK